MRILYACSELYPLIKTGGLADVSNSLPKALQALGHDLRIVLPYYREVRRKALRTQRIFSGPVFGHPEPVQLHRTVLDGEPALEVWLVDAPTLFDRDGGPYADADNRPWADSAWVFTLFCRIVAMLAQDQCGLQWKPDVLHCSDWQTGLAIPLTQLHPEPPATVFTIHNLAYQGNFSRQEFEHLLLPEAWWSIDGLEFHGQCSLLKAGIRFADYVTTVSPTYAAEILTPEHGEGFDGILRQRGERFLGILNGADYTLWNPATDRLLEATYDASDLSGKAAGKRALQARLGLPQADAVPLFGMVCRLVWQKGVDLLIDLLPRLAGQGLQIAVLGHGEPQYEAALRTLQQRYPDLLSVRIGYDETLAHRIEAGADFFLMPSRFEPCGLNQIYSLRYGTLPIVHATGGLQDTVQDHQPGRSGATGFKFEQANAEGLLSAMMRACAVYRDRPVFDLLRQHAMQQDFSWKLSSLHYVMLYRRACGDVPPVDPEPTAQAQPSRPRRK